MYHFTDEEVTKTYVKETFHPVTEDVVDARHWKLEDHVPASQQKWAEADQLREKLVEGKIGNPEDDDGPATALGGVTQNTGDMEIKSIESDVKIREEDHAPVSQQTWTEEGQLKERSGEGKKENPETDDGPATAIGGQVIVK